MLPAHARLRRSQDFRAVMRGGVKAGRRRIVVHALRDGPGASTTVGFVVSKAVGNAVVRHRVTRRLRHLVRARLYALPASATLVVRALPAAAEASSSQLGTDLDSALRKLALVPDEAGAGGRTPRRDGAGDDNGPPV